VAYLQPVVGAPDGRPVRVEIGQTMNGHAQLTRTLWAHALGPQLFILVLTAGLIALGLRQSLLPLIRLRDRVLARKAGTLEPLSLAAVPAELSPLVAAINDYIARLEAHAGAQRDFVQNAAHQLRTPLAVLNTQVSLASRNTDLAGKDESLAVIRRTLRQAVRLLNQLLTLSAADAQAGVAPVVQVDLAELATRVLEDLSAQAQAVSIDLGFEQTGSAPVVAGNALAMREILLNLVDNALRYTPAGGRVTVRLHADVGGVVLAVEDNGPGIAPAQREQVFARFFRIDNTRSDGCGLGLAIVREFAAGLGAQVVLGSPADGCGLLVSVRFPRGACLLPQTPTPGPTDS
jgi:two-component system sensor histidine kinase TctE